MNKPQVDAPPHSHAHDTADWLKTERLLLFTDAVFAIIVTLLALELHFPDNWPVDSSRAVLDGLLRMGGKFGSYALSFAVIALMWNAHLRRYRYVLAVNSKIVAGNLLQLMIVGLIPFATSLLARRADSMVVSLYAAIILANVLISWGTWLIAARDPSLVRPELTKELRHEGNLRSSAVAVSFAASIAIAWWSPVLAMWSWALQIPMNMIITRMVSRPVDA
jgi:uncharacterized membrane protein